MLQSSSFLKQVYMGLFQNHGMNSMGTSHGRGLIWITIKRRTLGTQWYTIGIMDQTSHITLQMISVLLRMELEVDTQSNSTTTIDLQASMNWVIMTAESKNRKSTTTAILPSTGAHIITKRMVITNL